MSDVTAQPVFETTASALQEKRKLRRHFRRFDMFFYLICTIVTLDTVGAVGIVFYLLGGRTRQDVAAEPVSMAATAAAPVRDADATAPVRDADAAAPVGEADPTP